MKFLRGVWVKRLALTGLCLWLMGLAVMDGYGQQDRAHPADVIVVLGSRVYSGGVAGPALTRRAEHAAALYRQGFAPYVLCSGGLGASPPTEAEAACGLAEQLGVPASAIVLETQAHSTEENALYTAAIARARGWSSLLIVSDGYHLLRATLLFRQTGLTVYASPAQLTAGPMNPIERAARESREWAALGWYWGKTLLGLQVTDFP
jgi:uncharacterized SAM-binding protein YcdF (DUF218 family)